jgi:cation diffusion facilitator family transporter
MLLTLAMMVLEITAGYYFNSMALLADGWHMSSHALALGLSVSAYAAARKLANDRRFSFGTWKIEILAGYTSAICLLLVAALMAFESIQRLLSPAAIHYQQAIGVATLGLLVNLACAWLLKDGHHHHHGHEHHHDHHHGHDHAHGDLNLRSAYLHVIADAATSVMAIAALLGGMLLGFAWLDSVMGLVGSVMVAMWALGLLRDSSRVLLDAEMDAPSCKRCVKPSRKVRNPSTSQTCMSGAWARTTMPASSQSRAQPRSHPTTSASCCRYTKNSPTSLSKSTVQSRHK